MKSYAEALAKFGDSRAAQYFEQAIQQASDNVFGPVNAYAQYLEEHGNPAGALATIELNVQREVRVLFPSINNRRLQLRKQLALPTADVEEELNTTNARLQSSRNNLVVLNKTDGARLEAALKTIRPSGENAHKVVPHFSHSNSVDDCRGSYYNTVVFTENVNGIYYGFLPFHLNLSEILYNEGGSSSPWGEYGLIGWTVRDRVYEKPVNDPSVPGGGPVGGCTSYPGTYGSTLGSSLQCGDASFCPDSANYCRAEHSGTTTVGASQLGFNDGHVNPNNLVASGLEWMAIYVIGNQVSDIANSYSPTGATGCSYTCANPFCTSSTSPTSDASPYGPMEFRSDQYSNPSTTCLHTIGEVCSSLNYYYGRGGKALH